MIQSGEDYIKVAEAGDETGRDGAKLEPRSLTLAGVEVLGDNTPIIHAWGGDVEALEAPLEAIRQALLSAKVITDRIEVPPIP